MGLGGKKKSRHREPEIPEQVSSLWYVACLVALVGVGVSLAAVIMPDWRTAAQVDYRYMFRSQERHQLYREARYGLYSIIWDGGSANISWPQRINEAAQLITAAVSMGQQQTTNPVYQSWAAQCPPACQDALTTRLSCYKRVSNINTMLLGIIAVAGALALIAIGWFFIFGKMAYLKVGCWFVAGAACLGIGGYWLWETNTCWKMITQAQQYPLPKISMSWYLMLVGSGLYIGAAVVSLLAEFVDRRNECNLKEAQRQQLLMEESGADPFTASMMGQRSMVPPGMMGGPPGMMGGHPGMMGGPPGMMGGHPGMMGGHPGMMGGHPGMMGGHPGMMGGHLGMMGGPLGMKGGPPGMMGGPPGMMGGPPGMMGGPPGMMGGPPGMMGGPPGMMGVPPGMMNNSRPMMGSPGGMPPGGRGVPMGHSLMSTGGAMGPPGMYPNHPSMSGR